MTMHRLLSAALCAGFISLDFTGWGPFMVAQPLVCGPLFGWLMGQLPTGVVIGGVVQLLWLDVTPVGVGIPFDATAVTLLATYWATLHQPAGVLDIVAALVIAVPFGIAFQHADLHARRLNSVIMRRIDAVSDEKLPVALTAGIAASWSWSWIRYTLCYAFAFWAGGFAWSKLVTWPRLSFIDQGLTLAGILLPVAGLGVALELFLSDEPENRLASLRAYRERIKDRRA